MIEFLLQLDRDVFLALNGFHSAWLDPIMYVLTARAVWIPLYAFLLYLVVKDYWKQSWVVVIGIVLTILLADQVTTSIMKPYFERLRPSHDPSLENLVHIVNEYRGSRFGFASSHAANTFGLATLFFLLMGKKRRWISLLFAWAAVVTYSRIYLGVHYPGDLIVGALVGALAALLCFKLIQWLLRYLEKRKSNFSTGHSH
jgi:undecaprenyl-diphosphatase